MRRWSKRPVFLLCSLILGWVLSAVILISGCQSKSSARQEQVQGSSEEYGEVLPAPETEEQILRRKLAAAHEHFQNGRYETSLEILRELEIAESANAEIPYLQARIALAQKDSTLALFHLKRIVDSGVQQLEVDQKREVYRLLATLSYDSRDFEQAYRYYLEMVNLSDREVSAETWIRLAEIAFYTRGDEAAAKIYLLNRLSANPSDIEEADRRLFDRLARRLRWSTLEAEQFGLNDANVSALQIDGDDLWSGTWNGGVSRYSVGSGESTLFKIGSESLTARTVRTIEVTPARVWIGTYQGLFQYTKSTSRWQEMQFFGDKVEALEAVGETVFVGTLGRGLWRSTVRGWEKITQGGLPGEFVNCLVASNDYLLIGSLNLGLVVLDLHTGRLRSFDSINPDLTARNVITLLVEDEDNLWIGTYGQGLYRWNRRENAVEHYSKASGQLADDWVLCAVQARTGLYFGTFGGGITLLSAQGRSWQRIGLRQGLAALDISAVTYAPPRLYFGTLGSGIAVLDESLVLGGTRGIE
jgi:ligand-binding sensor domain-containing protein